MRAGLLKPLVGHDVTVTQGHSLWCGRLMPDQGLWTVGTLRFPTKQVKAVFGFVINLKEGKR